ncbi:P-loop containing nucleoside triphosphate hydrolase protein [Plectosphaerella cucumerina]|uniref:P-loop containing nucleoside triphosphate hydrolase protein n=1 Tax=Plectosphaerella cucumerina TaxID=40658 RepID=A0A8K0TAF1_9PEZI|nr:P-loop containing nucleoside triphosphate hydrolase protein [Plectosphaerella cucumerina]
MLPLVVSPVTSKDARDSIAVDEETVKAVKRVLEHHQNPNSLGSSYGILQQQHTGGVLLYGPPGTGKTLLARMLASTTQSIIISATAADIQSQYCGQTPKVVKALFNLARRISPSIVFIDEADSLFGARSANDSRGSGSFYRETITQLLTEMDGFSNSKNNPLVILATNLPTLLDPAVLRRVPNITYMGPPTLALREKIFWIMLEGEILDPGLNVPRLAQMTPGYSGSDIKSLCFKAALMCDKFVESGEDKGKRLLTWPLFEQVLTGTAGANRSAANSVSRPLRDFAAKHDPTGFRRMKKDYAELESSQVQLGRAAYAKLAAGSADSNEGMHLNTDTSGEGSPRSGLSDLLLTSTKSFTTSHDDSKLLYAPLPMNSKKIRLLTLHPSTDKNAQVTGDLTVVCLEDYTQAYRDFRARLPEGPGHESETDRGLTRHFMWNLVNRDPRKLAEPEFTETAREVAPDPSLYEFCDRPLEQLKGLVDRYSWGDFLALSYVWGDPTKRQKILVNGVPFGVGDNLHAALLRLRSSYEVSERGLKVWIDAICINQDDLIERSVEVQKMQLIYTDALAVRGWLGRSHEPHLMAILSELRDLWDFAAASLHKEETPCPLQAIRDLHNRSAISTMSSKPLNPTKVIVSP